MSVVDEKSIFIAMKQDGPFAIDDDIRFGRTFTLQSRALTKAFYHDRQILTKYRAVRGQIFDLLQIDRFDESGFSE